MSYKEAFPDFELDVEIPEGFKDVSYPNDTCPSWMDEAAGLQLFIDFKDREDREFPEACRFSLMKLDEHLTHEADLVHTEDWAELLRVLNMQRKRVLTQTHVRKIFQKHLDAALAEIQRTVDEQHGDLAGMYGDAWAEIVASTEFGARSYLKAQCIAKGWRYDECG